MLVDVLSFDRYATIDQALNGGQDVFVPIANFETTVPPPALRYFGEVSPSIIDQHGVSGITSPVGFASLRDIFVGRNCWLMRKNSFLWGSDFHPSYHKVFLERDMLDEAEVKFGSEIVDANDPVCVVSGFNDWIYGHFLIETLPKILLAAEVIKLDPRIKVLLPARKAVTFIKKIMNLFIPEESILIFDDEATVLRCKVVILPTLFGNILVGFHSIANSYIWNCQQRAGEAVAQTSPSEVLMIQRSIHPYTFRKIRNYEQVIKIIERYGIKCFEPGSADFLQQVAIFSNCKLAISEYTSASHNSLFMPFNSRKILINWVGEVESRIAALRRQFTYYVSPVSGEPVTWSPGMVGIVEYDANIDALDRSIEHALKDMYLG